MAPKSILKKRSVVVSTPVTVRDDDVIEVPIASTSSNSQSRLTTIIPDQIAQIESEDDDDDLMADRNSDDDGDEFDAGSEDGDDFDEGDNDEEEAAIRALAEGQPRPAKKIKHTTLRPTAAPAFSQALTHLLNLPPTTSSLVPKNAPPSAHTLRLERRARTLIRETKAQHFARGHVKDVIAGWGPRPPLPFSLWESKSAREFERAQRGDRSAEVEAQLQESGAEREKRLRKLAQRGVVRLFNAIGAAQGAPEKAEWEVKKRKRDEEKEAAAKEAEEEGTAGSALGPGGKVTRKPNVLGGRGKGEALTNLSKASFLDLIRAGTTSSAPLKA